MRTLRLLCGVAAAAVFVAIPATISVRGPPAVVWSTAQAAVDVDINLFFTSLAPHGAWIASTEYNYIWVPTQVDANWSPYSNGHWIYTDQYGWYFVSDEPFAPIVYHYGRWGYDAGGIGWYWVPGNKFAGAWVVWRQGDSVIGWAPMPPQGTGYAISISVNFDVGSVPQHYWRLVPANQFLSPQLYTVAFYGDRRNDLFIATKPAGTVIVQNNIVINNVINITFVEQQTKQKVVVAKVETVSDPQQASTATATSTSLKAFVADVAPADKSVAPTKVVAKAEVQSPTKGQASAAPAGNQPGPTLGALPTAPADAAVTPKAGAAATATAAPPTATAPATAASPAAVQGKASVNPANARCTDATFAKNNPKDCAAPANAAAVTPKAAAAPAVTAATPPVAAPTTTTAPAAVQGKANANAKAATNADNRCVDQAFAKNNPKTCAVQGANLPGNLAAPGAPAAIVPPPANAAGGVSVQGNAAIADPRCVDLAYAKANAKTCAVKGNAAANTAIVPPQK